MPFSWLWRQYTQDISRWLYQSPVLIFNCVKLSCVFSLNYRQLASRFQANWLIPPINWSWWKSCHWVLQETDIAISRPNSAPIEVNSKPPGMYKAESHNPASGWYQTPMLALMLVTYKTSQYILYGLGPQLQNTWHHILDGWKHFKAKRKFIWKVFNEFPSSSKSLNMGLGHYMFKNVDGVGRKII